MMFARVQNRNNSHENINPACFCMLDENVADQFKVSNIPTLTGWNTSMSIREMIDQLEGSYGKQDTTMLFANNTLFHSVFNPNEAPETLFYRIEQCQVIQSPGTQPIFRRPDDQQCRQVNNTIGHLPVERIQ